MQLYSLVDYSLLRIIWWLLLGVLLIGFAVMDGFDLGTACILPFIAKNDSQRRIVINTIGPIWEGNQVWLITGGGAIFAAWPILYAVSFSGFYLAMYAILLALILRPVGFKYRSKIANPLWRSIWDWCIFTGGAVPTLIFGVALGNVLQGVPFHFNDEQRIFYAGSTLFELLNPFAIMAGLVSVAMLVMHGAAWQAVKTEAILATRARRIGFFAALATALLYAIAGIWLYVGINGYAITELPLGINGPSNPTLKTAIGGVTGQWFANYLQQPLLWLVPTLGIIAALVTAGLMRRNANALLVWLSSSLSIAGIIASVGVSMFPFILPSSQDPSASLTLWDSSSSQMTLFIMLVVTAFFIPLILGYTAYVYSVLRGKVTADDGSGKKNLLY